jgi:hypothetical protein
MRKRITIFAGHYGSGKTNIALNYARLLKKEDPRSKVTLADLDIVNPYFRTKDSADELAAEGIDLVVSSFANSNVDVPAMPKEIYSLVEPSSRDRVVMDIGGDDRGALALGRYVEDIRSGDDWEMLAVINASRPLTRTPEEAVEVMREIESSCALPFTGIVNNTNLGQATTQDDILASRPFADEVSRLTGLALRFTCCAEALADGLAAHFSADSPLFPLKIQKLYYQMEG